ncbi:unnamed protein product [Hermetia illucens]|uniref:Ionotropic receptor n=1 Tax=Hermetia illucens TaxID=343691 RepID=A0A7R8YLV0_HERIL|nr:unnamed protein product [Hermetia illucens]
MVTGIFFLLAFATVEGFTLPLRIVRLLQSASTIVVFDERIESSEENFVGILEVSSAPVIIIRGENFELYNYVHEDFVAVVLLPDLSNQPLDHVFASVKFLERSRVVFALLNSGKDMDSSIEILFRQCFTNGFLNVLLLHNIHFKVNQTFKIYTFLPFPTFKIVELIEAENTEDLFPDKLKNVYGYPIRTIFRHDYPRSYFYKTGNGIARNGGYLTKMLLTFAERYGASLHVVDTVNSLDKNKLISMIKTGEIDVAPNLIPPVMGKTTNSYPLNKMNVLLVAPQLKKVPRFMYLLKPFDLSIWVSLGSFLLYAALAEGLILILVFKTIDFGGAFMSVFLGIIYQGVGGRLFERWRFAIIHGQVLILGFILINFYLAILSSYLTVELFEKYPKTYSEIRESGMKIMAERNSLSHYIYFGGVPDGYKDLYFAVDVDELLTHVFSLNTSYVYGLSSDRIHLLEIHQRHLRKPLLSATNILTMEFIANCPVICSWVLRYKFDEFIFRAIDYGFIQKWFSDVLLERDPIDMKGNRTWYMVATGAKPLTYDNLSFLWNCLVFGWCISCVIFIFEKISFLIMLHRSINSINSK